MSIVNQVESLFTLSILNFWKIKYTHFLRIIDILSKADDRLYEVILVR